MWGAGVIFLIRPERDSGRPAIWSVNRAAFDTEAEAELVDVLRDGGFNEVSLVAEFDGQVVGHILFTPLTVISESGLVDALSLAPMAVLPSHQRQGIGSRLVEAGLQECRDQGHRIVFVLGHPEFYRRFGFSSEVARRLDSPFGRGDAWMARELVTGALEGIHGRVEYPRPFGNL